MQDIFNEINNFVNEFKIAVGRSIIRILSHNDCDGLTAASILAKALKRDDYCFNISIIKQMDKEIIEQLKNEKNNIVFILDLSWDLNSFKDINSKFFILDHHENKSERVPENVKIINPCLNRKEKERDEICGAGLAYLFAKALNERNKDLSKLAVIGMVGDVLGGNISQINNIILKDSEVEIKKGLPLLYSNMPLHKALEYSSNMFIPGVTGSALGAINLLRDAGIDYKNRTLLELDEQDLSKLVTSIVLRRMNENNGNAESILDNIYSIKFFGRIEDARELSTLLNACGKLGYGNVALALCFGSLKAKAEAENIYKEYKNHLVIGINYVKNMTDKNDKKESEKYVIYNCKNAVKDSVVGTVMSILSLNATFPAGKIIIGMAYRNDEKIKVSSRISKDKNAPLQEKINLKEIICKACKKIGIDEEAGGHAEAAGCLVPIAKEEEFINALENTLSESK